MSNLTPYLHLRGTARAALEFYASVFGGEPEILTFAAGGMPDETPDAVMHGFVRGANGFELMGSDVPDRPGFESLTDAGNITLSLSGTDEAELTGWYEALSDGGEVLSPLAKAPWGDSFAEFVDRFGIRWLINIAAPAA